MEKKTEKRRPKRLTLDVSEALHADIKATAAYKGMTIKRYVIVALLEALSKDRKLSEINNN